MQSVYTLFGISFGNSECMHIDRYAFLCMSVLKSGKIDNVQMLDSRIWYWCYLTQEANSGEYCTVSRIANIIVHCAITWTMEAGALSYSFSALKIFGYLKQLRKIRCYGVAVRYMCVGNDFPKAISLSSETGTQCVPLHLPWRYDHFNQNMGK